MILRYLIIILFLSSLLGTSCKGKGSPAVKTAVSDTFPPAFFIPAYQGYVNDFDSLFTTRERASLDSIIKIYDTAQFAVVTVDSTYFKREEFEKFTLRLFNTWGIGDQKQNNGVLICICYDYRLLRIENGLGIEKMITGEETKRIVDQSVVPFFKEGKFYEGVKAGVIDMKQLITSRYR